MTKIFLSIYLIFLIAGVTACNRTKSSVQCVNCSMASLNEEFALYTMYLRKEQINSKDNSLIIDECTGTRIQNDIVLTAAHCVKNTDGSIDLPSSWGVYFAHEYQAIQKGISASKKNVKKIVSHPNFNFNPGLGNDIAIMYVDFPSATVQKIAALNQKNIDQETLFVAGFGMIDEEKNLSSINGLNYTSVNFIRYDDNGSFITSPKSHGGQSCRGDSGGPLFIQRNDDLFLAGITSRNDGNNCGESSSLTKNTNVTYYQDWMTKAIQQARSIN